LSSGAKIGCLRKKVTSKKPEKRRDDVDYQLNRVGQNKVPEMGQLSLPKAEPIRSMDYFDQLIAEIQAEPLPQGYATFLRSQLQRLSDKWRQSVHDTKKGDV